MTPKLLTHALVFLIATGLSGRTCARAEILALRTFDGGVAIGKCTVRVDSVATNDPSVEPSEIVTITCADKAPFHWQSSHDLSNLTILSDPSRVVATWECGTGMCSTVFAINPTRMVRSVVNGREVYSSQARWTGGALGARSTHFGCP